MVAADRSQQRDAPLEGGMKPTVVAAVMVADGRSIRWPPFLQGPGGDYSDAVGAQHVVCAAQNGGGPASSPRTLWWARLADRWTADACS
jgi:hypothetical protein